VALLVVGLLLLTGCSGLQGTGDKGYVTGDGLVTTVPPGERVDPVSYDGDDLDGKPLSLAEMRGKPVVVVVWGSWCPPCRAETPGVIAAHDELGDQAHFVGLNTREPSAAGAQAFVRASGMDYPSFYTPSGDALLAFQGKLGPRTIPAFVVLDAKGRIAASIIGSLPSQQTLVDLTQDVVDEGTADG
jgi:thiol-disulfide isomerase/thioredoxin